MSNEHRVIVGEVNGGQGDWPISQPLRATLPLHDDEIVVRFVERESTYFALQFRNPTNGDWIDVPVCDEYIVGGKSV